MNRAAIHAAVDALLDAIVEHLDAPSVYTQTALPPDVHGDDAFLRLHRAKVKAGEPGWSRSGRVRSVTAEAWRAHVEQQTKRGRRRAPAPVANDVVDELDVALGIRTKRRAVG